MQRRFGMPADVYSYGVTVWELMKRQGPYPQLATNGEVARFVVQGGRLPMVEGDPEVPSVLNAVTEACVEPKPQVRPAFAVIVAQLDRAKQQLEKRDMSKQAQATQEAEANPSSASSAASTESPTHQMTAAQPIETGVATGEAAYRHTYGHLPSIYDKSHQLPPTAAAMDVKYEDPGEV